MFNSEGDNLRMSIFSRITGSVCLQDTVNVRYLSRSKQNGFLFAESVAISPKHSTRKLQDNS